MKNRFFLFFWFSVAVLLIFVFAKPPSPPPPPPRGPRPFDPDDSDQDDDDNTSTPDEEWDIFKKKFGKKYNNPTEEAEAKKHFMQVRDQMRSCNKKYKNGQMPFKIGCNDNADVGMCGSCWAFAANAVVEGQIAKYNQHRGRPLLIKLSVQQLLDCSTDYGTQRCTGGDPAMAWHYLGDNGSNRESEYPYSSKNGNPDSASCKYSNDSELPFHVIQTVKTSADQIRFSFGYFEPRDVDSILRGLNEIGPLAAAMNAQNKNFFLYKGGVYKEDDCSVENRDHSVAVVGYGTDTRSGLDYWIIKNSWGTKWGENGYGLIARGVNMCGIEMDVTYTKLAEQVDADGRKQDLKPSKAKRVSWTADASKSLKGSKDLALKGSKKIM